MYEFIKTLKEIYNPGHKSEKTKPSETKLYPQLRTNLEFIRESFNNSVDLTIHEMQLKGIDAAVISIDNLTDKEVLGEGIIKPLLSHDYSGDVKKCLEDIKDSILCTDDVKNITTFEELFKGIMSGFAVIALDGCNEMLSIGVQGFKSRSISEPESDVVQRGSKEGFVEPIRTNIALLRRRMKNPKLYFEVMTLGNLSKTEICLCYLRDIASPDIVQELKKRLRKIDVDTVLAAGYIVPYLEDKRGVSLFSTVGITERSDTVCGKLSEGRIAILVDGVPSALIVPYLFVENFQTLDDYSNKPYFATFTRRLKYAAFFIAMMLPGIFVALGTFNPEMFPTLMLNKIAGSIGATPLSLMSETILLQFVYEIMRESGLRMPQPLGYAVSIVGGLVIGDTAINAGLIGAPTLMVVAVAIICSYIIPNLYAPVAILRLAFTVVGGIWGIWGIAALFCFVFIHICTKSTFGIPYTAPLSPIGKGALRDVFIRSDWKTLSDKTAKVQNMPGSHVGGGVVNE